MKLGKTEIEQIKMRFIELNKMAKARADISASVDDLDEYREGFMHALIIVGVPVDEVRMLAKLEMKDGREI